MTNTIQQVKEFHEKFGHPVATEIADIPAPLRILRVRLIAEELLELCAAWGIQLKLESAVQDSHTNFKEVVYVEEIPDTSPIDHIEAADALGDLDYVVAGANLVAGYPAEAVLAEIHRSNMSKCWSDDEIDCIPADSRSHRVGENRHIVRRNDGKIVKSPSYSPARLEGYTR